LTIPIRLVNGLITISLFYLLFTIYRKANKRFYLYWGLGFLLYGLNILLRMIINFEIKNPPTAIAIVFMLLMGGFTFIITGIGDLINKTKIMLLTALLLPLIEAVVYFVFGPDVARGWTISIIPYLIINVNLLIIRRKYSNMLDLLIVGWLTLLLVNIAYALNLMSEMYVEVMAIFGKLTIYVGMTNPKFSFIVDDLKRFLLSGIPETYPEDSHENFTIINPISRNRATEIMWIKKRVVENTSKAVRTILVTTYDLIAPSDMKTNGFDERNLYFVRMLPGVRGSFAVFKEHIITMGDDLCQFDILLSDIINFSKDRKINCEIILYNLSAMIHMHGWQRVYSLLISKMPQLKASSVHLYAFYYPETHEEKANISKFEKLADRVLKINI